MPLHPGGSQCLAGGEDGFGVEERFAACQAFFSGLPEMSGHCAKECQL